MKIARATSSDRSSRRGRSQEGRTIIGSFARRGHELARGFLRSGHDTLRAGVVAMPVARPAAAAEQGVLRSAVGSGKALTGVAHISRPGENVGADAASA